MILFHDYFTHTGTADPITKINSIFVSIVIIEFTKTISQKI